MLSYLQAPLLFGLIAASVTTVGLVIVARRATWTERNASIFGLAAAGMLATLAFLHIIPEAFHLSQQAPVWLAAGFFGGLLLHNAVALLFPERPGRKPVNIAFTPIIAIASHSFIDGIIYAVTFANSFESGLYASLGLILHEFPEGVIAFAIMKRAGVSNMKAFWIAFLAAAATTPAGALVSAPIMFMLEPELLGALFAMSAGLLLFVATGPLMAPLKETRPARGLGAIAAGVVAAMVIFLAPIHGGHHHDMNTVHDDDHDHAPGMDQPDFSRM
ncbi:zinc ABC transporter permease [Henriciella barbarensis]|uniref:Zinc ABC transporter permease n=1 Tax=Henriciella barbarensis TaxID=86342 RepID=A0A399R1Z9_9PROT|nr:ZIP family metal transporter [Henriciella barbarensis]RIJ23887.1 zinc ABC transporter permease [Henriciella barbarensis]